MKIIRWFVFLIIIATSFFLFYDVNRAYSDSGETEAMLDCTSWNMAIRPGPIYFMEGNGVRFKSADLRVARYRNPSDSQQICDRFFLESTGQTLWQMWKDPRNVSMMAIFVGDQFLVKENVMYGRNFKREIKNTSGTFIELEVGMFDNPLSPPLVSHTFTIEVIYANESFQSV